MAESAASYGTDHYVQRLDLSADPFGADYNGDYFFAGAMRRQQLDQLVHFSRFSDQVMLLVGSSGSGTSTLVSAMLPQLQQIMDCCFIDGDAVSQPDQILSSLSEQLQFEADNSADFLYELRADAEEGLEPEPVLIVIDQAQYLPLESFELLNSLYQQAQGVIHLLIVGEYQIEQLASLAGFDRNQIKRLELEPLTAGESGDFLLGLLRSVGYAGDQPLSSDQLAVLHEQSTGNIAEIRRLLPALLTAEPQDGNQSVKLAMPTAHIAAVMFLVAVLLIAFLYRGGEDTESSSTRQLEVNLPAPAGAGNNAEAVKPVPEPVSAAARRPDAAADLSPQVAATAELDKTSARGEVQRMPVAKSKLAERPLAPTIVQPVPTDKKVDPVVAIAPAAKPPVVESPAVQSKVQKIVPKAPVQKVVQPARAAVTKGGEISARERRLLGFATDAYLLQLMGAVDENRVRGFTKQFIGRLPITYYETRRNNKPWFVAVAGPYSDRTAAVQGIKVLPAELQKQKPWPRSVSAVQAEIRANH